MESAENTVSTEEVDSTPAFDFTQPPEPERRARTRKPQVDPADPLVVAARIHPGCKDHRVNATGDVSCLNEKGQVIVIPASRIAAGK